jgi:predicted amino acid-binding ACT domain protein
VKLWDFRMMQDGKIELGRNMADLLGMPDDSEVFMTMFRYESDSRISYEVVVSPFGPENYRELCFAVFQVKDQPGALAQCAKFLKSRNIDILNSESIAFMPSILMKWVMLIDLSFYGDRRNLEREFKELKDADDPSLSYVDSMRTEPSNLADRYTKGSAAGNARVLTRPLRKMEKQGTIIKNGTLQLPEAYLGFLGKRDSPVMLIGDSNSWLLSLSFLSEKADLWKLTYTIPDRPGAIYEISNAMAEESINILAGYSQVLVYYQKMLFEIVVDISGCKSGCADFKDHLLKKTASLGKEFSLVSAEKITFM